MILGIDVSTSITGFAIIDDNNKIPSIVTTVPAIFIKGRPLLTGAAIEMFLENDLPLIVK